MFYTTKCFFRKPKTWDQSSIVKGKLRCVRVFKALMDLKNMSTPAECNIVAETLVGFWPLNSEYGGVDLSGYGHNITLHGTSFADNAVAFAGTTSSYGEIPASSSLQLQHHFTWMAEYYPEAANYGPLFEYLETNFHEWSLHIWYNHDKLFFRPSIKGISSSVHAMSTTLLVSQQWNKIGLSFDSEAGVTKMIVNGVEEEFENHDTWIGEIGPTDRNVYLGFV